MMLLRLNKRYRLMLWWGAPCLMIAAAVGAVALWSDAEEDPAAPRQDGQVEGLTNILQRDVSSAMVQFRLVDFDEDQWTDLYVANDVSANAVFHNDANGSFSDIGPQSLAADYRGAMGLAVGDHERDGDLDLFVTHWIARENAFFINMLRELQEVYAEGDEERPLIFTDSSDRAGLGQISLNTVGWATGFADFDKDGNLDLWVVNGNTLQEIDDPSQLVPQRTHLFRQQPPEGYFEIGEQACRSLSRPFVGRGGAAADFDGDGQLDLAIMAHGGTPILLRNATENEAHWISVRLRQTGGNTSALGAKVTIRCGDVTQTNQVGTQGSYLSQSPTDLHFGIASAERVDEIHIRWPDDTEDCFQNVRADQLVEFTHAFAPSAELAIDRQALRFQGDSNHREFH
ncbi:MAG: CRTAC1 family protein [Pirellulaceae bacterium]